MNTVDVYIPVNRELAPQYKINNRFYNAKTLRPEPEVPHDKAFRLHLTRMSGPPVLIYTRNNGWVLSTSNSTAKGSSSLEDYEDFPIKFFELKIPSDQVLNNGTILNRAMIALDSHDRRQLETFISRNIPLRFIYPYTEDVAAIPFNIETGVEMPVRGLIPRPQLSQLSVQFPVGGSTANSQSPRIDTFRQPSAMDISRFRLAQNSSRNSPPESPRISSPEPLDQLPQKSYETLVKQLYGLPVTLPPFLVVNGLRVEFIPFSQLSSIQIERYIIEPLLQPWAGPPSTLNRIITIFDRTGMTYLVKAKYDPVSNQIFPPV